MAISVTQINPSHGSSLDNPPKRTRVKKTDDVKSTKTKKVKTEVKSTPISSAKSKESLNFDISRSSYKYPIFRDCIKCTTDDFWKTLLDDLSQGKCPKSIYISNGTIYTSNKRKGFTYIIPDKVPEDKTIQNIFDEFREIIIENTAICSTVDISKRKKELKEKNSSVDEITNDTTWSEIRKKNIRENFLIEYVLRMRKEFKMNWIATRHLYSIIQLGFIGKTQISKHVHFSKKSIQKIEGIVFDKKTNGFINTYINNDIPQEKEEEDTDENYLSYHWDRYVLSTIKNI